VTSLPFSSVLSIGPEWELAAQGDAAQVMLNLKGLSGKN